MISYNSMNSCLRFKMKEKWVCWRIQTLASSKNSQLLLYLLFQAFVSDWHYWLIWVFFPLADMSSSLQISQQIYTLVSLFFFFLFFYGYCSFFCELNLLNWLPISLEIYVRNTFYPSIEINAFSPILIELLSQFHITLYG